MRVHPEFYGMIMFAQAAPAGAQLLRLGSTVPSGVKVWATRAGDGAIHVVVINKRLAQPEILRLSIAGAQGAATVEQLRAPSVHATSGVTLGGQTSARKPPPASWRGRCRRHRGAVRRYLHGPGARGQRDDAHHHRGVTQLAQFVMCTA